MVKIIKYGFTMAKNQKCGVVLEKTARTINFNIRFVPPAARAAVIVK